MVGRGVVVVGVVVGMVVVGVVVGTKAEVIQIILTLIYFSE